MCGIKNKIWCAAFLCILFCHMTVISVAAQVNAEAERENQTQKYDYSEIDRTIRENSSYAVSFQDIIDSITGNESIKKDNILSVVSVTFYQVLSATKTAMAQIVILSLFSAAINCFGPSGGKEQISDTARMILSISLIAVLIAVFYTACTISKDTLEGCISVCEAIVPVFFSAVAFSSGSVTAAVYYELILMLITTVNIFYKNILIRGSQIYILFAMADAVTKEKRFTKAAELCTQIIKWSSKTALIIFTGLGGLKGMFVPVSESYKKNMLYRAFETIPGVGGSIETISQTVTGAANVLKNGIGTAAVVALLLVCFVPVLKLMIMSVLFKITAAVIEPAADKRVVAAVNSLGTAIGMLLMVVLSAVSLFMLMSAMIVTVTNFKS